MPAFAAERPPLPTLLSQLLVAFTIEFDNEAEARITAAGAPPWIASLAMWANYLRFVGDPAASRGKAVRLTARGLAAKSAAGRRLAEVEEGWRQQFGAEAIDGLRDLLDGIRDAREGDAPLLSHGLAPHPGGRRGRRPYLTQTQAVLRDPRAALPRYPVVLHRGGFPDGS